MSASALDTREMSDRHNLPAEVASFVGREREIAEIRRLVLGGRLLTLTGVGGSGKTRLAVRVGAEMVPSFAHGVWLVPLAGLGDSRLVPRSVATALGVRGSADRSLVATLATALGSRRLLLVLDNCEHVIGACARLAETLLGACPHLRVLATSREPLRVAGEVTWRVPPLALPVDTLPVPESLEEVESIALFVDRSRARLPTFVLTPENAAAVAGICRRMEGLPLAIELAAAQMGTLSPIQIAERLDDALGLLGGGSRTVARQETLRTALDWSYGLLSEGEKALLRRLAVFAGGFDLEAVEGICAGDGIGRAEVLGLLRALVEKSLVESETGTVHARYRLLEPVRQYAQERICVPGEMERLQRRHAQYFLELAERAEPKLMSGERGMWMERLAGEQDNLRAALSWTRAASEQVDRDGGLRLAGALAFYWTFRGEVREGLEWTEAMLSRGWAAGASAAAPDARAKALYAAAELAWLSGQTTLARERAEESEALWRTLGDKRRLAYTLQSLPMAVDNPRAHEHVAEALRLFEEVGDAWGAALSLATPDYFALMTEPEAAARGEARLQEAAERARLVGDGWITAQALNMLGDLARSRKDVAGARRWYEEALELLRREDLTGTVPSLLHNLAYLALHAGDTRRALRLFRQSLAMFRDQGDQRGMADCLDGLAGVLAAMKQAERAARLFGAAEALRQLAGVAIWPGNVADYQRGLDLVRDHLDEEELALAWAAGRALPLHSVIAEVLAEEPSSRHPGAAEAFDLTPREREVAQLVAEGQTNRQIGARLFITEGTARLHVKHILQKLGFSSRTQIAAWVVERGTGPGERPGRV